MKFYRWQLKAKKIFVELVINKRRKNCGFLSKFFSHSFNNFEDEELSGIIPKNWNIKHGNHRHDQVNVLHAVFKEQVDFL